MNVRAVKMMYQKHILVNKCMETAAYSHETTWFPKEKLCD